MLSFKLYYNSVAQKSNVLHSQTQSRQLECLENLDSGYIRKNTGKLKKILFFPENFQIWV